MGDTKNYANTVPTQNCDNRFLGTNPLKMKTVWHFAGTVHRKDTIMTQKVRHNDAT